MNNQIKYILKWIKSLLSLLNKKNKEDILILLFIIVLSGFLDLLLILSLSDLLNGVLRVASDTTSLGINSRYLPFVVSFSAICSGSLKACSFRKNSNLSATIASNTSSILAKEYISRKDIRDERLSRSEVISTLSVHTTYLAQSILMPLINFISSLILLIIVFSGILYKLGFIFIFYVSVVILIYMAISLITSKRLKSITKTNDKNQKEVTKNTDEMISGERDIRAYALQDKVISNFYKNDYKLKIDQGYGYFLQQIPRIIIESSLFIIIALAVVVQNINSSTNDFSNQNQSLIILISLIKILPYFQQVYGNLFGVITYHKTIFRLTKLREIAKKISKNKFINLEEKNNDKLSNKILKINKLRKFFNKGDSLLPDKSFFINELIVERNQKIAIYGKSGSGKSNLLDIIMGLAGFDQGSCSLKVGLDEVAFASQNTFIADGTFGFNITNNNDTNSWDLDKMEIACKKACIEFNDSIPFKFINKEIISGGQSKRIGLARALYSQRKILILDEVDSGLDRNIIFSIFNQLLSEDSLTIICVTHNIDLINLFPTKYNIEI